MGLGIWDQYSSSYYDSIGKSLRIIPSRKWILLNTTGWIYSAWAILGDFNKYWNISPISNLQMSGIFFPMHYLNSVVTKAFTTKTDIILHPMAFHTIKVRIIAHDHMWSAPRLVDQLDFWKQQIDKVNMLFGRHEIIRWLPIGNPKAVKFDFWGPDSHHLPPKQQK